MPKIKPQELFFLAQRGWRWEVNWNTVPKNQLFEWAQQDIVLKIISALIRRAEVRFVLPGEIDQVWTDELTEKLAIEIENTIVYSGYNVWIREDSEESLIIEGISPEHPVQ